MPERTEIAPGLEVSRVITGLWQVADLEREAGQLPLAGAADALVDYARAGFDTFDMADHYGSAELIAGEARRALARGGPEPTLLTKWCPAPGAMTPEVVAAGVDERARRLGVERIDLLQLHWWRFEHPGYLDCCDELARLRETGRIRHLGVTNFDSDHLHLLLAEGYPIVTNQVCVSLLDRRALGEMTRLCLERGVRLLAYGTLAGGWLGERWLGVADPGEAADWSKMKYRRFIEAAGGWAVFQRLLEALREVAVEHGVSIANVATRWVLEQPAVGAVIVGARLTEREHRADNLALGGFALTAYDHERIDAALADLAPIPGDCGQEYRKPPYLTASGDLGHHLGQVERAFRAEPVPGRPGRWRVGSGVRWESVCGFSRALREGRRVLVSGTTATHGAGRAVCPGDVRGQSVYTLDKIAASLEALGGSLDDVVRTRIYMKDCARWEEASRVHGRYFADVLPANTLVEVSRLVGDYEVEIEAEAYVGAAPP